MKKPNKLELFEGVGPLVLGVALGYVGNLHSSGLESQIKNTLNDGPTTLTFAAYTATNLGYLGYYNIKKLLKKETIEPSNQLMHVFSLNVGFALPYVVDSIKNYFQ
jgi:hypothetical protein